MEKPEEITKEIGWMIKYYKNSKFLVVIQLIRELKQI
jgi:hypothetical protein